MSGFSAEGLSHAELLADGEAAANELAALGRGFAAESGFGPLGDIQSQAHKPRPSDTKSKPGSRAPWQWRECWGVTSLG